MPKASFSEKMRYRFEKTLSGGPIAIIGWLAIVSFVIILLATAIIFITGINPDPEAREGLGVIEGAWQSLMRTLDSGTMGGDEAWPFRIFALLVTLAGIFIISTLIGSISSGIDQGIENLRKGKSKVLESSHTLILGYSPKIYSIITELVIANENQKKPKIVILSTMDKVELEDDLRSRIPNTKNTEIIVRSGSPLVATDIEVVNPHEASSIIILSPDDENNQDRHVIKTVLSITNGKHRKAEKYHIVSEIMDMDNVEAAELVGKDEAIYVLSSDLIARLTAQTCRQSGLSIVYSELLQFDGDEIYFYEEKALLGKTYQDALFSYEDSAIMGIFTANGDALVNPPMDYVIQQGDQVIAISEDDDTIRLSGKTITTLKNEYIMHEAASSERVERTVILGWNKKGLRIIEELDNYVLPGSEVVVLADTEGVTEDVALLSKQLANQKMKLIEGDINDKATLESLEIEKFDHIILLSYTDIDIQESDVKTLICLLHLRNIAERLDEDFSIVSEMLDIRNRELAEVSKADDFIVSEKLLSLIMAQLSENKDLKKIYDILFEADGSEIYLKDISSYVQTGVEMDFYTVLKSAALQGHTALGYRIIKDKEDMSKMYGVSINPKKSQKVTFSPEDKIIVLAED
ncbi:MAG: CASTOR/POLLUX-related putative ion channel [Bacteroidota bacterium]